LITKENVYDEIEMVCRCMSIRYCCY